jgi:hypothetical protein
MGPYFISQCTMDLLASLLPESHRRSSMGEIMHQMGARRSPKLCQPSSMRRLFLVAHEKRDCRSIVSEDLSRARGCIEDDQFRELLSRYSHRSHCRRNLQKRIADALLKTWPSEDDELLSDMGAPVRDALTRTGQHA